MSAIDSETGSVGGRSESVASNDWPLELARLQAETRLNKEWRRFILVVCGDGALVLLTWLLNTVSQGTDFVKDFLNEIDFNKQNFFGSSLFDVALLSVVRVLWLLLCYGCLHTTHWWPVTASTVGTSVFLVTKVLYYFRGKVGNAPQYIVIIGSLIAAWIELWLSPVKPPALSIRPREHQQSDQSYLVRPRALRSRQYQTEDEFRSAMEHASSSDEEGMATGQRRRRRPQLPGYRPYSNTEYVDAAKGAMVQSKMWLAQTHGWPEIRKRPLVKAFPDKTYGKLYYLQLELNASTERVFSVLHTQAEATKTWNKNVLECKVIFRVDDQTDLTYSMSAPAVGGYIKSRDFLDVRRFEREPDSGVVYISSVSVFSSILPPGAKHKSIVRGVNGPNLWVLTPMSSVACHVQWIMNTNLKGDIPRRIIDRGMTKFLADFAESLTAHVEKK